MSMSAIINKKKVIQSDVTGERVVVIVPIHGNLRYV
jgi:hypothetical protein